MLKLIFLAAISANVVLSADECPENQIYDECSYIGTCSPGTCEDRNKSYHCPADSPCKAECRCKNDYYRNALGQCISSTECSTCKGQNEVYDLCPSCHPQTCESIGKSITSPAQSNPSDSCKPACRCIPGYYRNKIGQCISEEDCLKCTGPNEYFSCGGACDNVCATLKKQNQTNCPIINITCNKKCYCEKDYARDSSNTCIPIEQCPETTTPGGDCNDETALDRFTEGNTDFTLNFLYQMIVKNPVTSVIMSPFLVLVPLAQLTLYTNPGESYNQLMNALNLNNKDEIRSVFPILLNSLQNYQNVTLDLGAKIYVNENYQLTDDFQKDTKDVFDAEAENINFGDPDKAADIINDWVAAKTKDLIKSIVNPDMFTQDTRLVLVNAIYFLGNWVNQFNPNSTKIDDFHVSNNEIVEVPMMSRKGPYKYTESTDLDCKIVEIPYKGGNFSYVILVPNQINGYVTLADKIRDPNALNNALDAMQLETCNLYIPRHEITTGIDLTEILELLNITDIFETSKSDLSGILTNSEDLGVSDAIQKANIKVDETGTEAAAVTAIIVGTTSAGPVETVYEVKADRPYIFFLYQDRQPLFCGAYAGN